MISRQPSMGAALLPGMLVAETLVADFGRRDRFTLLALAGWTLFVWVGRIRNVIAGELDSLAFAWRLGVAAGFSLVALGLVALVLTRSPLARPVGGGLALIGALWWLIRGGSILLADHAVGFKVVHTVLAVVTIGLSWLVLRWWSEHRTFATERA